MVPVSRSKAEVRRPKRPEEAHSKIPQVLWVKEREEEERLRRPNLRTFTRPMPRRLLQYWLYPRNSNAACSPASSVIGTRATKGKGKEKLQDEDQLRARVLATQDIYERLEKEETMRHMQQLMYENRALQEDFQRQLEDHASLPSIGVVEQAVQAHVSWKRTARRSSASPCPHQHQGR